MKTKYQGGQLTAEIVKPLENLVTALQAKPADVNFLVMILGVMSPDAPVFAKDYVYKRVPKVYAQPTYDNSDGLWNGLPPLSNAVIRGSNKLRVPKETALELKLLKV